MQTGTIKTWMDGRGFGFIRRDSGEPDLFVHITRVLAPAGDLFPGDRVQFEVGTNPRGGRPEAQNVRVVEA